MRISFFHSLLAYAGLTVLAPCHAFTCAESEVYQQGQRELSLVRQTTTAHFVQAAAYIQKKKGVSSDAALEDLKQQAARAEVRVYDDQLNDLGAKIKEARHDSAETCEALLTLQRQHAYVGQQKIDFIAKQVMGEDSAAPR